MSETRIKLQIDILIKTPRRACIVWIGSIRKHQPVAVIDPPASRNYSICRHVKG